MATKKDKDQSMNRNPEGKGGVKPGEKRNPGGKTKLPRDLRAEIKSRREEFIRAAIKIMFTKVKDAEKIDLKKLTLAENSLLIAYIENDTKRIGDIENRLFGKPQESLDITSDDNAIGPIKIIVKGE